MRLKRKEGRLRNPDGLAQNPARKNGKQDNSWSYGKKEDIKFSLRCTRGNLFNESPNGDTDKRRENSNLPSVAPFSEEKKTTAKSYGK